MYPLFNFTQSILHKNVSHLKTEKSPAVVEVFPKLIAKC